MWWGMEDLAGIAVRTSVIYLYVLALMRFAGKRTVGDLSPWDFLVALIIGDMFDDVMWGEVPLAKAIVGLTTVLVLHILVSYAGFRSRRIDRLLGSVPTPVVRDGRLVREGQRKERMEDDEVWSLLRQQGVERLREIREALLEPGGGLSVLRREEAKPVDKRDLPDLKRAMK